MMEIGEQVRGRAGVREISILPAGDMTEIGEKVRGRGRGRAGTLYSAGWEHDGDRGEAEREREGESWNSLFCRLGT